MSDLFARPLFSSDARSPADELLTPEVESALLSDLQYKTGQAIENIGLALDTPAAIFRGVAAGKPLSGFSWSSQDRVSGAELLSSLGIKIKNPRLRTAAGFGTEVVADPLFWFSGGTAALSAGGDAARAANLLDKAPLAYMAKHGIQAAEQTGRGKYLTRLMDSTSTPRTLGMYRAVPPVGQRVAQANVTLRDVLGQAVDQDEAMRSILTRVGSMDRFNEIADQPLGGLIGMNVGKMNYAWSPPGTSSVLDALDTMGARAKFSGIGRGISSMAYKPMGGAVKVGDQFNALRMNTLEEAALRGAREAATKHSLLLAKISLTPEAKRLLGADTLFSPAGNDVLTRLAEGKGNATDLSILRETPGLQGWLDNWDQIRNRQFAQRNTMGLTGNKYKDKHGTLYSPRYGDEFDFEDMAKGVGPYAFTAAGVEAKGRKSWLRTPGGTDDLRQISMLPEVMAHSMPGAKSSDEEVGRRIMDWFKQNYPAEPIAQEVERIDPATGAKYMAPNPQVVKIASTMKRRRADLPANVPVYAAHPANAQARRILSHSLHMARADFVLEAMSEAAVKGRSGAMSGRFRNLAESWGTVAAKTGFISKGGKAGKRAELALRSRLAMATNTPIDKIDLSQFSIPEEVVRRLERISDFYTVPESQKALSSYLDGWTRLFKGFVLATPRRFFRDAYSNAVSIWLETGDGMGTLKAMAAGNRIAAGQWDQAMPYLRTIPRYQGMTDDAIREAFTMDVGTEGVLSGLKSSEVLSSARAGEMGQLVPGSTPVSVLGATKELIPDGSVGLGQQVRNFFSPFEDFLRGKVQRYEEVNPILRWSGQVNDAVDSMGRLGGFMALLKQGNSPAQAASRIRSALVDYQDLTLVERKWLRSIFPWWSYQSKIGRYVVESMFQRPGGLYGQMIRASNTLQEADENAYIPANLRRAFAIRLPDEVTVPLGLKQEGVETYLKDIDLPGIDVLNLLQPGDFSGTAKNVLSQTAPFIQGAASLGFNRDLFTDRPLNEATTPQDRIYRYFSGSPEGLSPVVKTAIGLIPGLQVPISIGGALTDERIKGIGRRGVKAMFNFGTGVKIADVDENYLDEDLQQKIAEELRGKTRTMSRQFVPEELLPTLTPRQQALFRLSQKRAKATAARRKAQKAQEGRAD